MNLYNNFCYPTLEQAVQAKIASVTDPAYLVNVSHPYTVLSSALNNATIHFNYSTVALTGDDTYIQIDHTYHFPTCYVEGSLIYNTGITLTDASYLFWSLAVVWLVSHYFNVLKTAVRGY